MINFIGKTLVLVQLVLGVVALAGAAGIYLQFVDWGWKEPRKDVDVRIPSEYDKRAAALKLAVKARDQVLVALLPAEASLRIAQASFGKNHLDYNRQLEVLRTGTGNIDVKAIKFNQGQPVIQPPVIGAPVQDQPVAGLSKSYKSYVADLNNLEKELKEVSTDTRSWIEKNQAVTYALTGGDEPGLYDLLEMEMLAQKQAAFEKEYLQPQWSSALEAVEVYRERRVSLENSLERLKKAREPK